MAGSEHCLKAVAKARPPSSPKEFWLRTTSDMLAQELNILERAVAPRDPIRLSDTSMRLSRRQLARTSDKATAPSSPMKFWPRQLHNQLCFTVAETLLRNTLNTIVDPVEEDDDDDDVKLVLQ